MIRMKDDAPKLWCWWIYANQWFNLFCSGISTLKLYQSGESFVSIHQVHLFAFSKLRIVTFSAVEVNSVHMHEVFSCENCKNLSKSSDGKVSRIWKVGWKHMYITKVKIPDMESLMERVSMAKERSLYLDSNEGKARYFTLAPGQRKDLGEIRIFQSPMAKWILMGCGADRVNEQLAAYAIPTPEFKRCLRFQTRWEKRSCS